MVDSISKMPIYFAHLIQKAKEQQLKELDLSVSSNINKPEKLEYIPKEVFDLIQLEKLYLSNNVIRNVPKSLAKLKNLNTLDLSNNVIEKIP